MRRPDFLIIGAMKAGTTTLFNRLATVPGVSLPAVKEPAFFSERWSEGSHWYSELFATCDGITGEASAGYADAAYIEPVAQRIHSLLPDVRLIYVLRHPVERIRSHYRHEVLRSRERREFTVAVGDSTSSYVTRSLYGKVTQELLRNFDPDQLLIMRSESLDDEASWQRVLSHIGASSAPLPDLSSNVSADKAQFTPLLLWLWERNLLPKKDGPVVLRRFGRALLTRSGTEASGLLESVNDPVSPGLQQSLDEDQALLRSLVAAEYLPAWSPKP